MKKLVFLPLLLAVFILTFPVSARARETADADAYYSGAFAGLDEETKRLLGEIGVSGEDLRTLMSLAPENLLDLIRELFGAGMAQQATLFGRCLALMLLMRFFVSFLHAQAVREAAEQLGSMLTVFLLIAGAATVGDACVRAVRLTESCMLTLIPVLGTVVAFSGNPLSAVSVQTTVFAFAQGVGVLFADLMVPLTAVGAALGSAAAISPMPGAGRLAVLVNKFVIWATALVSGVFSAVLGVRGAAASAADGVTAKGLRFLVGGVPVVGSALGEALSSLSASLALAKNSVAVLGILAVAFICLPPACSLLVWKGMLSLLSAAAELFELKKLPPFIGVLTSVCSVLLAVLVFNACVYVIALAIVVSVKAM